MGLHYLTGKEHQIEYTYKVSGRVAGSRTCLRGIGLGLHDLTGKEQQFQYA